MSGRNSRIVRNRDRSSSGFEWDPNMLKIIGIAVAVLVIVIAVIAIFVNLNKGAKVENDINAKIPYEYFLLSTEKNVGVIDKNGNTVIEAKYDVIEIPNPSKDVFICYNVDGECEILNKNAKKILSDFENVETVISSNDNAETEKFVLKYKKDNMYGLINLDGQVLTEAIYEEISSLNYRPGRILIKKDGKYGILDSTGNIIIETKYDGISADGYCSQIDSYSKTGYIVSEKSKDGVNFGYIDYEGEVVIDTKYESIERALEYDEEDIYLIAMQKGKQGVFKNSKKIINFNFQDINYTDLSNIFIVNKNGKYGFYNLDGKVILKPEYTNYSIAGNYISVQKNDDKKLYDINGNLVNTNSYTKMIETDNPSYFIAEDEDGFYSIISKDVNIDEKYIQVSYAFDNYFVFTDETGKSGVINAITEEIEIKPEYDFIILIEGTRALQAVDGMENLIDIYSKKLHKTVSMEDGIVETFDDGHSIVYSETDMKYIDSKGQVVENTSVNPNEKLYAVCENGKWGFKDASGKNIVECKYDIVTELNEYGFAGIKKDGKWGVINQEGKIVVEPKYELETYYFPQFIGKYLLLQSEIVYCEEIKEK